MRFEPREGGGVILPTVESILLVKVIEEEKWLTPRNTFVHTGNYPSHNFRVSKSERVKT